MAAKKRPFPILLFVYFPACIAYRFTNRIHCVRNTAFEFSPSFLSFALGTLSFAFGFKAFVISSF